LRDVSRLVGFYLEKMSSPAQTIQVRSEGRTAWITLDRPPLNILNIAMMSALDKAVDQVLPHCDFVVFHGAGQKAFSAGAEVADHVPERVNEMLQAFHAVFRRLADADCVTIAAVHGHCLGGGMELATFCDIVVAAESAKFGQPEIKLGCFPPIAMVTFPRLIGLRGALDLILSGRIISAQEARELGFVSRLVSDSKLSEGIASLLEELRGLSPAVLRLTKRAIWKLHVEDFDRQLSEVEQIYLLQLMQTHDAREGIRAFLEKRAPAWEGR
jgi:cyclohexa-1,5-dienecarbonyl-CoA hydratase